MPIKTLRNASERGLKIFNKVRGPIENRILQQHSVIRYSIGGITIVIGALGLIIPVLPGFLLIIAGIGVVTKNKVHIKTVAILVSDKTKHKITSIFHKTISTKNITTDKFHVLSSQFSQTLGEILSDSTYSSQNTDHI